MTTKLNGETITAESLVTREQVAAFLQDIACGVVDSNVPSLHTMLALDRILRVGNASEVFDDELKEQARDLWLKVKSTGAELQDPPLLFEVEHDFSDSNDEEDAKEAK